MNSMHACNWYWLSMSWALCVLNYPWWFLRMCQGEVGQRALSVTVWCLTCQCCSLGLICFSLSLISVSITEHWVWDSAPLLYQELFCSSCMCHTAFLLIVVCELLLCSHVAHPIRHSQETVSYRLGNDVASWYPRCQQIFELIDLLWWNNNTNNRLEFMWSNSLT